MTEAACELCSTDGGEVLYRDAELRIVAVTGADGATYRGFCRVIWNAHVKEMTDLAVTDRSALMKTVFKLETILRAELNPEKMNIASLGNMTPHLHWHVIPRFTGDATFPRPIWAGSIGTTNDTQAATRASSQVGTLSTENAKIDWRHAVQLAFASEN
jgi:diadenosine tetraphosphate (Ap4A) HIT family hydrolase